MGGGPEQPLIRAYADAQGVGDLCTFTGRVSDDDLCRILSSADVAVDPDPKTAWSDKSTMNKIMEYMFFGLPIVCYDLTEHKVSAQDAAALVEANSERALAEGIGALLDDPGRRARMSRYGAERVRQKLVWQHSVPPLLAAYDAIFARLPQRCGQAPLRHGHGLLARASRQRWARLKPLTVRSASPGKGAPRRQLRAQSSQPVLCRCARGRPGTLPRVPHDWLRARSRGPW